MDKVLFQEYSEEQRLQMLNDNCNKRLEDHGYEKPLSKDQVKQLKDKITSCVRELRKVEAEKKEVTKGYNDQIGKLKSTIETASEEEEKRTTFTCETCFEFLFREERKIGVYNKDGVLIEERPATLKELRDSEDMFKQVPPTRKTGTNN